MSASRARMLARIRAGLAQRGPWLADEAARAEHAPPPFVHPAQADVAEQFVAELTRLAGHVHRCADDVAALDVLAALLEQHAAAELIAWELPQIGLPDVDALLAARGVAVLGGQIVGAGRAGALQRLDSAPVCISGADIAIAESGTLVLRGGPGRARLASLLAPVHIAVLRRDQIVRGLGEALGLLRQRYGPDIFADSSSLTLISGPSRTGDIEQRLVLGVHGPNTVHVILIDAAPAA